MRWFVSWLAGGEAKGLNDAGVESFMNRSAIARETCQNVVDAHDPDSDGVATVEFELLSLPVEEIPGIGEFSRVFESCREHELGDDSTAKFFQRGEELLGSESVPVLRIRDSNTTGLSGDDESGGRWSRLVRSQGHSQTEGPGGGTFGIGQRAAFAQSNLRLVFYSTRVGEACRFMGKYLLCTCRDSETNRLTQNVGYYGLAHSDEDIQCASTIDETDIPEFFRRTKQGTDIYIVGFRLQDWKPAILRSVLEHFFAAIDNRQLEVVVRDGEEDPIRIDEDNIADIIQEQVEATAGDECIQLRRAYHSLLALRDGKEFSKEIDNLGLVRLYVNQHEKALRRITYMRSPRMKVYDSGSTLLREFQAVLLVDDETGNDFLKSLEDPKHEKWDPDQPSDFSDEDRESAKETLLEIARFIRETLKGLRRDSDNVAEDLPELSKWLPAEEDEGEWNVSAGAISGETTDEETSSEHTPDSEAVVTVTKRQRTQSVESATDATTGEADGETGGGGGDQQSEGGTLGGGDIPGEGEGTLGGDEIGGQRIRASDVRFRSWQISSSGGSDYRLVITSPGKNVIGDLQLVAVGETARSQLEMDVLNATDCETGEAVDVVRGKMVDLELRSGIARRIDVELDIDVVVSLAVKG